MIFDRTAADVENAKNIRLHKVQKGETLTEAEILALERGMMTVNTLNRIENKQAELKSLLNTEGYWFNSITNREWVYTDIFNNDEFVRILRNLDVLRNCYYVYSYTPMTPPASYNFEDINALEKILYDLETMIDDMKNHYRQCGTFQCGEVNES